MIAQESELVEAESPVRIPSQVLALVQEIGSDALLADAALQWVRQKKQEVTLATLVALRGSEWVERETERIRSEQGSAA